MTYEILLFEAGMFNANIYRKLKILSKIEGVAVFFQHFPAVVEVKIVICEMLRTNANSTKIYCVNIYDSVFGVGDGLKPS